MDAFTIVEDEVRDMIRSQGLDPATDPLSVRRLIDSAIADYDRRSLVTSLPVLDEIDTAGQRLFDSLAGFGELQPLLDDDSVEEIWLNSPHQVFVARGGRSELTSITLSETRIRDLVERMLKTSGRRLDLSSPFVDASLPDGSRLHVVIPDITRRHWAVNIRKFISRASSLEDLVRLGSLTQAAASFLADAVASGMNILVSGPTGSGKTTMLNCLASAVPPRERVVTVEEIFELEIPLRDVVALQCRQPNLEGEGEIPLRRLVKEALRMRPDRLIVGEVREAESLDMLIALNSGQPGMATVHANSASDALMKICTLPLLAGENITRSFIIPTVASCIDLVVHCVRDASGQRYVQQVLGIGGRVEDETIETSVLFLHDGSTLQPSATGVFDHPKLSVAARRILVGGGAA
ncbi:CpaF family protein [Nesterenkonia flava]|uniref:ATPase, T2SS/T4P/T4SS family n=1 Tax=Nesterenkonia flava TaxID=469799 RepID=A0ABU1FSK2_9MICC|nr:ATPase, T2SS/T4P/T4SS family [Nesterenkonia flava]MDR5711636.1 ATPase, T2SS/T4P/T4SS family [Nesterenkonia flava]